MTPAERFQRAIAEFDRDNADDPNQIVVDGVSRPRELVDAERLSAWVERLEPSASEALRLAARCQHLRRWEVPRSSYPAGRLGYLEWRKALGKLHAARAATILSRLGYKQEIIDRVRAINLKQGLKIDPEVQTMEDALCLAFLEHEALEFAATRTEEQVVEILRKTWRKMSARGQAAALGLPMPDALRDLVTRAIESR